jgi:putative peptidoglycan binding protein
VTAATQWQAGPKWGRAFAVRCAIASILGLATAGGAAPLASADSGAPGSGTANASGFDAQGMWVWYVSRSSGGTPAGIIGRARRSRVGTVYVKAGDGSSGWSQFTSSLVSALHAGGLKVCAWQFVYGGAPYKEANVGAAAVAKGADCLIIDAEGQYEGKYASADRYIRKLRSQIGPSFPVSLAGFPYVDYHPGFPYSVFLGPEGAQYNQPQMYWKTIGTSVGQVYAHTYLYNRVFQRPIYPIGQTYSDPPRRQLKRFRRYGINYGASGVSWWSWQETSGREWGALGRRIWRMRGFQPSLELPVLRKGSKGDLVVWAQEHLIAAGQNQLPVTGLFKGQTYDAVAAFQQQKGLLADGMIGTDTWRALLDYTPVRVAWGSDVYTRARSITARPGGADAPLSASLPGRDEIDPGPRP